MGLKTTWTVQGIGLQEEAVNGNGWNEGGGGAVCQAIVEMSIHSNVLYGEL